MKSLFKHFSPASYFLLSLVPEHLLESSYCHSHAMIFLRCEMSSFTVIKSECKIIMLTSVYFNVYVFRELRGKEYVLN